jgi:hypothetical protein
VTLEAVHVRFSWVGEFCGNVGGIGVFRLEAGGGLSGFGLADIFGFLAALEVIMHSLGVVWGDPLSFSAGLGCLEFLVMMVRDIM